MSTLFCPSLVHSPNPRATALDFILDGHSNSIQWEECRLIWDSLSLISDRDGREDQVAPFGVQGQVATDSQQSLAFQLRYIADLSVQPSYFIYAAVEGKDPLKIVADNLNFQESRRFVKESVDALSAVLSTGGINSAIQTFLAPPGAANGAI